MKRPLTSVLFAFIRPTMHLLLAKGLITPLFLFQAVNSSGEHICLRLDFIFLHQIFLIIVLQQRDRDLVSVIFFAFKPIQPVYVTIGQASHVGASHGMALVGNDAWIIGPLDLMSAVVVENRRLDGERGGELGFEGINRDVGMAIDDAIENFRGHLQGK